MFWIIPEHSKLICQPNLSNLTVSVECSRIFQNSDWNWDRVRNHRTTERTRRDTLVNSRRLPYRVGKSWKYGYGLSFAETLKLFSICQNSWVIIDLLKIEVVFHFPNNWGLLPFWTRAILKIRLQIGLMQPEINLFCGHFRRWIFCSG